MTKLTLTTCRVIIPEHAGNPLKIKHGNHQFPPENRFTISYPTAPWCWNMHTNIYTKSPSHVGKYTSTMELVYNGETDL